MKYLNLFLFISIAITMVACGDIVTKQKIGGTLKGEDVAESSEVQVLIGNNPLLETSVAIKGGKFVISLPPVPEEQTIPWLNADGSEHVRIAEADVFADNRILLIHYDSISEWHGSMLTKSFGIYRLVYADRHANMKGWSNKYSSQFFNWEIAGWLAKSTITVEWDGFLEKGWNAVFFTAERRKIAYSEKRTGRAIVKTWPENPIWQSSEAIALKDPPTATFDGQISLKTKEEQIYIGYNQSYFTESGEGIWEKNYLHDRDLSSIPVTDGKCNFRLPTPPQSVMNSYFGLIRLFYNNGINSTDLSDFDATAGKKNQVNLVDIGFFTYDESRLSPYTSVRTYYNGDEVIFVYSDGEIIITGSQYRQSGSIKKNFNLHFKKGWNTVLYHNGKYEMAEIKGEIELSY